MTKPVVQLAPMSEHVCVLCGSTCDDVTALKMRNRDLEREVLRLGFMLRTFEQAIGVEAGASDDWFPAAGEAA